MPEGQGRNPVPGYMAGVAAGTGTGGIARSVAGHEGSPYPVPPHGRGPLPPQHRNGPPAQAGNYPCGPAQASPLPPATGQARDEPKEESPARQRSKRMGLLSWVPEPAASPAPLSLWSLSPLNMLLFGGYRRISRKNVLDHHARHALYDVIAGRPGIEVTMLAATTGINENTLRYHLDRLLATGTISSLNRPGVVRYFPNKGAYSRFEHLVFHYLWTDTPRRILGMLYRHPGLTRQQVAEALAIASPSVTRQMDHLIGDGLVENRSLGRSNHYYLTAEAAQAVVRFTAQPPTTAQGWTDPQPLPVSAG